MSTAPVIIFGYNRKDHLKQTVDALGENTGASNVELYVFLDGYKAEKDKVKVQEVHEYGKELQFDPRFKSVNIIIAEENKGLAASVIKGVSSVIKKHNRVIVLEDDIVTSHDFLTFMNQALDYYEKVNQVWSISGYTFDLSALKDIRDDVYLGYRASSWGWATWKDRWDTVDWNIEDYNSFRFNLVLRSKFNRGGTNMADMLDRQMAGEISSWAIRWCYAQFKQDKLTVFPCKSKVLNIGQDGSGTHSDKLNQYNSKQFGEHPFILTLPKVNKSISKEFKKRTGLSFSSRLKRFYKYNIIRR